MKIAIHTVFILKKNILFVEEWIHYHILRLPMALPRCAMRNVISSNTMDMYFVKEKWQRLDDQVNGEA